MKVTDLVLACLAFLEEDLQQPRQRVTVITRATVG